MSSDDSWANFIWNDEEHTPEEWIASKQVFMLEHGYSATKAERCALALSAELQKVRHLLSRAEQGIRQLANGGDPSPAVKEWLRDAALSLPGKEVQQIADDLENCRLAADPKAERIADTLLAELDKVRRVKDQRIKELNDSLGEKLKLANEFISKYNGRFLAFETMEECADVEDGVGWDAAFEDLRKECERFGIKVIHPDCNHAHGKGE